MIPSLQIKNFKNLKDFKIDKLGRVNLFAGKNNTGKSTLLEAVSIFATKGNIDWIVKLLKSRGENIGYKKESKLEPENVMRGLASLFTDRNIEFKNFINISVPGKKKSLQFENVNIKFVYVSHKTEKFKNGLVVAEDVYSSVPLSNGEYDSSLGIEIKTDSETSVYRLESIPSSPLIGLVSKRFKQYPFQMINSMNNQTEEISRLWNSIVLTPKEDNVIRALKIIEPRIERFNFKDEGSEKIPVVTLTGDNVVYPLKSMGDGLNRILHIIMSLVNSDNGFLLIDEFENGLHYSVQAQLWEVIFELSEILNIQVFATTHSNDCIRSFAEVSAKKDADTKFFRFDKLKDEILYVVFERNELSTAIIRDIEIR